MHTACVNARGFRYILYILSYPLFLDPILTRPNLAMTTFVVLFSNVPRCSFSEAEWFVYFFWGVFFSLLFWLFLNSGLQQSWNAYCMEVEFNVDKSIFCNIRIAKRKKKTLSI